MVDEVCQPGQSGLRPGHLHKLQNIQQFLSSRQTYHVEWIKFIEFFAQHYQAFLWSLLNLYRLSGFYIQRNIFFEIRD